MSSEIHLTNNCQQKTTEEYSKFEEGNTLPFHSTILKYLQLSSSTSGRAEQIMEEVFARMKELAKLKDAGIITEEEFSIMKAKLIDEF